MGKSEEPVWPPRPSTIGWAAPGAGATGIDLPIQTRDRCEAFVEAARGQDTSEQLAQLRRLIDQLEALWLTGCAAFDESGQAEQEGATSLAAWIRHRCHVAPGEAHAKARVAQAITSGELQTTGRAMLAGELSWRHAQVIESTVNEVPTKRRGEAELALQDPAKTLDPTLLRRVGAELLQRLDADKAEELAVRRLERRGLTCSPTLDGMVAVNGLLDPIAGSMLMTSLDTKTQPGSVVPYATDSRTWAQRRADALSDICREWLELGDAPRTGGSRPHVSVLVDLQTLKGAEGAKPGQLSWVGPITPNETQLIACDSVVSRIVMDGPSAVLDVGRATRTIAPAIRKAVVARDRTCVEQGCYRPPEHCDVHHIVFWENGGATELANLVLLCRRHHRYVHQRGWRVRSGPGGSRSLSPPSAHQD